MENVREGNSSGSNIPDGRCIVCYSKGGSGAEVRPGSIRPICKGGGTRHTGGTNIAARVRTLDDGIAPGRKKCGEYVKSKKCGEYVKSKRRGEYVKSKKCGGYVKSMSEIRSRTAPGTGDLGEMLGKEKSKQREFFRSRSKSKGKFGR